MSSGSVHITSTPTKADVQLQNTGVELKAPSSPSSLREGQTYTYNFGFQKLGDILIDFRKDHEIYSSPQNVKLLVRCRAEPGQNITNALIEVKQSSEIRDARIIYGGIGQNYITIQIKGGNTYCFSYEVRIFGSKITRETHLEEMN